MSDAALLAKLPDAKDVNEALCAVEVARRYGVPVSNDGMACCLWHDDTKPSMKVYSDGAFCFVCKVNKSPIDIIMAAGGVGFPDALEAAARLAGMLDFTDETSKPGPVVNLDALRKPAPKPPPWFEQTDAADDVHATLWSVVEDLDAEWPACPEREYIEARGLSVASAHRVGCRPWSVRAAEIVEALGQFERAELIDAGFMKLDAGKPKPWPPLRWLDRGAPRRGWSSGVAIPKTRPGDALPVGYKFRRLRGLQGNEPKSLNQCGPSRGVFVFDDGHDEAAPLIIVEGEIDFLTTVEAIGDKARIVGVSPSMLDSDAKLNTLDPWLSSAPVVVLAIHCDEGREDEQSKRSRRLSRHVGGDYRPKAVHGHYDINDNYRDDKAATARALEEWITI